MRRVALALLFLVALVTVACSSDDAPKTVERRSAEVYMDVDATPEQIDAVREHLRGSRGVRLIEYLDQDDAYAEFERLFADDPELVTSIDRSLLPASFRVDVDERELTAFRRDVEALAGVDVIQVAPTPRAQSAAWLTLARARQCGWVGPLRVYPYYDATPEELSAIEATLRADPDVKAVEHVDPATELRRLECLLADTGVPAPSQDDGPGTFSVAFAKGADDQALQRIRSIPGVDGVQQFPWIGPPE